MADNHNFEDLKQEDEIEVDIRDLDELYQNKIKDIIGEAGLQDKIDMERSLKKDEHIDEFDLITFTEKNNDNKKMSKLNFSTVSHTIPLNKMGPANKDEIKNILLGNEVKYSMTIQYIHLSQLVELDKAINFFPNASDEEFLNLMQSVETYGILTPLLVIWDEAIGKYITVSGNNRLLASRALYANSKDERYLSIPCILLDSATDSSIIQGIVISTNMQYRKLTREALIKAIHLLDDILTKKKKNSMHRNELNITETIATSIGVSRSTVNNYRDLKNLSPKAMDLVCKRHMNLAIAKRLAAKDHEMQDKVIGILGKNINDLAKVRALLEGPAKKIYDKDAKSSIPETWEKKIERTMRILPKMTTFMVTVATSGVEKSLKVLAELKKEFALEFMTVKKNSINKFFRVKINDYHMEQYVKRGFVSQTIVDKIKSLEFNDIIKLV